jgi:hypothetical protein
MVPMGKFRGEVGMKLACRCGEVQGEIDPRRAYARATCYCRDCRAFARWLGGAGLLDAAGGTDIVAMAPDGLRFTRGFDKVACLSLGPRGLLRWYASCCRTPLGNIPRDPKLYYLGVPVPAIAEPADAIDAAYGAPGRIAVNTGSATGEVKGSGLARVTGTLRIVANLLAAKLRGRRNTLLFDEDGLPLREPQLLDKAERDALSAGP